MVWLVRAPMRPSGTRPVINAAQMAQERGWTVFEAHCVRLAVTKGERRGRIVNLLERRSANRLYTDIHRGPVAVLYDAPVRIRTSPGAEVELKRTVPIDQFCKYKAFAMSLNDNRAAAWASAFGDWLGATGCDGPRDPRTLPLHIFKMRRPSSQGLELDSAADRQRFRRVHIRDGNLVDADQRRWRTAEPGARHGRDPQFVRNQELPLGFHWDVRKAVGTKIETPMLIWKVGPSGHLNVYADGHTRRGTGCRAVWSRSQSTAADEADRLKTRSQTRIPGQEAGN